MTHFVCLSPHFPPNFKTFWLRLKEANVQVLGISDSPWEELGPELQTLLTEYYRVEDMHNLSQLEAACQHFIKRYGKIDRLESHNEYWLETEAHLRTVFDIPGPRAENIRDIKSKERMKVLYRQGGIAVAEGAKVCTEKECRDFIQKTGYPVVVKPDIGVGAARTWKLSSEEDLRQFIPFCDGTAYLIEEFIEGELYSFDGLTDSQGKILFSASQYFNHGIMEIVNKDLDLYHMVLREIPAELEALGQKVVRTFGIRERFFHFEFFHRPDGRWVALEVNIRPPGGLSMDLFNYANDMDLYKGYAEMILTGALHQTPSRNYFAAYIGRKHRQNYQLSHDEIMQKFSKEIIHHQNMAKIFYPVMGYGGYLVKSPDQQRIHELVREIHALKEA